jgi:peroxiredoxin
MLIPRQPVPALALPLVGGGRFDLAAEAPDWGTLVVFYRGLHCPICIGYLGELEKLVGDFGAKGVGVVAVSSDGEERARAMAERIGAKSLRIAYDLALPLARDWGLFVSTSRGKTSIGIDEPALFSEPGIFIIRPDGTLYYGAVQTMPFARPHFRELLAGLDFVQKNDYPARGEHTGPVDRAA